MTVLSALRSVESTESLIDWPQLPANSAAAAFREGVLTDELASVRLKSACIKMAVSPTTNLVLAGTEKGIVPYNLTLEDGVPHFVMPQVQIPDVLGSGWFHAGAPWFETMNRARKINNMRQYMTASPVAELHHRRLYVPQRPYHCD